MWVSTRPSGSGVGLFVVGLLGLAAFAWLYATLGAWLWVIVAAVVAMVVVTLVSVLVRRR